MVRGNNLLGGLKDPSRILSCPRFFARPAQLARSVATASRGGDAPAAALRHDAAATKTRIFDPQ